MVKYISSYGLLSKHQFLHRHTLFYCASLNCLHS